MNSNNEEGFKMTTTIQKWGNSLAVRIPKSIADHLNVDAGSKVSIELKDNEIKIIPENRKPTLEELMARVTPENQHNPVDWGQPQGKEIW